MEMTLTLNENQTRTLVDALVATLPVKVQNLLALKGQFISITYGRDAKTRKGVAPMQKFSKMNLRVGVEYDNIQAVKDKREDGTLPPLNAGLSWGQYVPGLYPFIIEHKGELYLRVFTVNGSKAESTFARDGVEVSREVAKVECLASEFAEREDTLETMTLKIAGILEVNGKAV